MHCGNEAGHALPVSSTFCSHQPDASPSIVLTGGPCGGKTTLMRELRAEDPECRKWVLVPESAPVLFQAGLSAREKSFQAAVVRVQIALEDACALAAPAGSVLVCHRGTLDPLAYWLRNGWEEVDFFALTGMTEAAREREARLAAEGWKFVSFADETKHDESCVVREERPKP
jgi:predicted ATPase